MAADAIKISEDFTLQAPKPWSKIQNFENLVRVCANQTGGKSRYYHYYITPYMRKVKKKDLLSTKSEKVKNRC